HPVGWCWPNWIASQNPERTLHLKPRSAGKFTYTGLSGGKPPVIGLKSPICDLLRRRLLSDASPRASGREDTTCRRRMFCADGNAAGKTSKPFTVHSQMLGGCMITQEQPLSLSNNQNESQS